MAVEEEEEEEGDPGAYMVLRFMAVVDIVDVRDTGLETKRVENGGGVPSKRSTWRS